MRRLAANLEDDNAFLSVPINDDSESEEVCCSVLFVV